MIRVYEFLLRPTSGQKRDIHALRKMARDLTNAAISERREAWLTTDFAHRMITGRDGERRSVYRHVGKGTSISYVAQSAHLKEIRANDPDGLGRWSFSTQQQVIRRVNKSYQGFFRRVKAGETPGYPRFKPLNRVTSVDMVNGDGAKWDSTPNDRLRVYVQGVGHIKVHAHRAIPQDANIKSLSLKFDGNKIYVRAVCHTNKMRVITNTGKSVGIDMGVNPAFLTASDGFTVPSPRHFRKNEKHTANLQRAVDRSKRGSGNRKRKVTQLRAAQSKTARQRRDFHHKVALMLITNYDVIVREDLQASNMSRTPKPKPDPNKDGTYLPNGAAAKAGLNKSIHDAGWGTFFLILDAKAEEAGCQVVKVSPKHTSQKCEKCHHIDPASRNGRNFCCTRCGHTTDADEQASRTVLRLGLESWQDQTAHAA